MLLRPRQEAVLRYIVADYIATARPVGSRAIADHSGLNLSSATVRNEMAELEDLSLIERPHHSSGGVPSDRGYRYYVETLIEERPLSPNERERVRLGFEGTSEEFEAWCRLAADLLAQLARNLSFVTPPRAVESHLRQIQLVSVQDYLVLLVVVLQEAKHNEEILRFERVTPQEELSRLSNRLNNVLGGANRHQIAAHRQKSAAADPGPAPSVEDRVVQALHHLMEDEDHHALGEAYIDGVRHLLSQPEYLDRDRLQEVLHLLEDRSYAADVAGALARGEGVRVIIGGENPREDLRDLSLILTSYGEPGGLSGTLGVVGPTRMDYGRGLATVGFLRSAMDKAFRRLLR